MKKFWIVKKAPTQERGKRTVTGDTNNCYSYEDAEELARKYTKQNRSPFCVLEVVACFDVADVVSVDIE
jgi:hypothetical protein